MSRTTERRRNEVMLARERYRVILGRLQVGGSVRVSELARSMRVTEETVRRDLLHLDAEGKLLRIHGGAIALEDESREQPYDLRKTTHLPEKRNIAMTALQHVRDGDVIAIDASSTATELARLLPDRVLTVITNSLVVPVTLLARPRIRVICTGGTLDVISRSFIGTSAEKALEQYNFGRVFFSCKGIDPKRGLSVASEEHARIKRRMIDLAGEVFLLADHSKFGVRSVVAFARLSDVDVLITDNLADPAALTQVAEQGVQIEQAQ